MPFSPNEPRIRSHRTNRGSALTKRTEDPHFRNVRSDIDPGNSIAPGAELSALHGSRQGFQDPLAAPLRRRHLRRRQAFPRPKHLGSPFGTRPLTAPAPGSDRRRSGEGRQVGGNSDNSGTNSKDQCTACGGSGPAPTSNCTCAGNAHTWTAVVCAVRNGTGHPAEPSHQALLSSQLRSTLPRAAARPDPFLEPGLAGD
jgi:hypothetical protein